MTESDRFVIFREDELRLAKKEADRWTATDRVFPSLWAAKRSADDAGLSLSFRNTDVDEKDRLFYVVAAGKGHIWHGRSILCKNETDIMHAKVTAERPRFLCTSCIVALRQDLKLFDMVFPQDEIPQPSRSGIKKAHAQAVLMPTPEEQKTEGILLLWSEALGRGILTKRTFWPGFLFSLSEPIAHGIVPLLARSMDEFFDDHRKAGGEPADIRAVLLDTRLRDGITGPLFQSAWALLLNRSGIPVPETSAFWLQVQDAGEGFRRPPSALDREGVLGRGRTLREWNVFFRDHVADWRRGLPEPIPSSNGITKKPVAPEGDAMLLAGGDLIKVIGDGDEFGILLTRGTQTFALRTRLNDAAKAYAVACAIIEKGVLNPAHWQELQK